MQGPLGITARNVNHALPLAVQLLNNPEHVRRIAPRDPAKVTLELLNPMCTVITSPLERVLFHPERDANPFFHLLESLWILAGRDDVEWLAHVLPRMKEFSDDGVVFHGAYGARMRRVQLHDGPGTFDAIDQLGCVVQQLKADPDTRRAVVALYQPDQDAGYSGKDMPCNVSLAFKLREGRLRCTVFNRSNDMVWGAYGANIVQFSIIQEYVAAMVGCSVGALIQWSDSFHVYENEPSWQRCSKLQYGHKLDPYDYAPANYSGWVDRHARGVAEKYDDPVSAMQLVTVSEIFDTELQHFMNYSGNAWRHGQYLTPMGYENLFLDFNARLMFNACMAHQLGNVEDARSFAEAITATDWRLAAQLWLERRYSKGA